jgi:hypothetical protein
VQHSVHLGCIGRFFCPQTIVVFSIIYIIDKFQCFHSQARCKAAEQLGQALFEGKCNCLLECRSYWFRRCKYLLFKLLRLVTTFTMSLLPNVLSCNHRYHVRQQTINYLNKLEVRIFNCFHSYNLNLSSCSN